MAVYSVSSSKLDRNLRVPEATGTTVNSSDDPLLSHTESARPQTANSYTSSAQEPAFAENWIDQYASPLLDAHNPSLLDVKSKDQRTDPGPSKRGPMNFVRRRSSTSTRPPSKSESLSRNFRKLRLDLQRSARSISKTEPTSESPDWACRTSLAIEAGRISMDSVDMRNQELVPSNDISLSTGNRSRITSTERKYVRSDGLRERGNTYTPPSTEYDTVLSTLDSYSEGTLHFMRRPRVTHRSGRLEGMKMTLGEGSSARHDSAQTAVSRDLDNHLPALPQS